LGISSKFYSFQHLLVNANSGSPVLIVIIIAAVVAVVVTNGKKATGTAKRSLFSTVNHRVVSSHTTKERSVEIPGLKWTRDNLAVLTQGRPVQPGVGWTPPSRKERRFQA
jgi:hypothetical protein